MQKKGAPKVKLVEHPLLTIAHVVHGRLVLSSAQIFERCVHSVYPTLGGKGRDKADFNFVLENPKSLQLNPVVFLCLFRIKAKLLRYAPPHSMRRARSEA